MTRKRQKPHAFDCVAPDGGRHLVRADENGNIASGWASAVPLYRHPAPSVETFMITMLRKGDGMPEFQFMAQPDYETAQFIAVSVMDEMVRATSRRYTFEIKPGHIGSAVDGFAHVIKAAVEATTY